MNIEEIRARFRPHAQDMIADLRARTADRSPVAREAGYQIRNADGDEAVVRIYDEIWFLGVNALDLAADLDEITAPNIRVEINSPGGDVWDGVAIYNALRAHPAKVTTRVDGMAASIASVIAQAGDHRVMLGGSQMMIHNAWGLCVGDHGDHSEMADILAHQDDVIAGIYASRAGKSKDEFKGLMDAETWLTAEGAVELGLADEVHDPAPAKDAGKRKLADQITEAATFASSVMDDVEELVAAHADEDTPLTGTKREGLVALAALAARAEGLLHPQAATPAMHPDLAASLRRAEMTRATRFTPTI